MKRIPGRTLVEIIKPSKSDFYCPWYPEMDKFVGVKALVRESGSAYVTLSSPSNPGVSYYSCSNPGVSYYSWAFSYIKVLSKDKNGDPEPYDNQERAECYWCGYSTKKIKEKINNRTIIFNYCPECKR
jgi:hypothetical protein